MRPDKEFDMKELGNPVFRGEEFSRSSENPSGPTKGSNTIDVAGRSYANQSGLAKLLGVTERTLCRWEDRRIGPPRIKIGKLVLFDLEKLPTWLESHESRFLERGSSKAVGQACRPNASARKHVPNSQTTFQTKAGISYE
jgi:hypothetical protein